MNVIMVFIILFNLQFLLTWVLRLITLVFRFYLVKLRELTIFKFLNYLDINDYEADLKIVVSLELKEAQGGDLSMLRKDGQSISEIGGGYNIDYPARSSLQKANSNSSDKEMRRRRMLKDNILLNTVVPPLVIPSHDIAELIGHPETMRRENSKNT